MRTRRITMVLTVVALMMAVAAPAALAGPPEAVFEANDAVWACGAEGGLPPGHCINTKGQGSTGVILVFEEGFGPQESFSTNPQADGRTCPHDEASPDDTWWDAIPNTLWVCHH
jgi:hypothetical protein